MKITTHAEASAAVERLVSEADSHGGTVSRELPMDSEAQYWTLNKAAREANKSGANVRTVRDVKGGKITMTARPSR